MDRLYTVDEVAELFQVSSGAVRRLCARRGWPHVVMGRALRFSEAQMREIVDIQTVQVSAEERQINDLMARTGLTRSSAEHHLRQSGR